MEKEEVFLCLPYPTQVFKATFSYSEKDDAVHGQIVREEKARFYIAKVMKTCSKWEEFDSDVHRRGAAILQSLIILHVRNQQKILEYLSKSA